MLLLAVNEAFDRRAVDTLLAIARLGMIRRLSGEGVLQLAPLIAAGFVSLRPHLIDGQQPYESMYLAELTERGKSFVDHWKIGDQLNAITFGVRSAGEPAAIEPKKRKRKIQS
jgi:hypothetical protein